MFAWHREEEGGPVTREELTTGEEGATTIMRNPLECERIDEYCVVVHCSR